MVNRKNYEKSFEYLDKHAKDLNKQDSKSLKFELLKLSENYDQLIEYICEEVKADNYNFGNWETLFWIYEKANKNEALKQRLVKSYKESLLTKFFFQKE